MITNLEKNFEAIRSRKFVDDYKKNNKKKEKVVYHDSKKKIWVLSEKKDNKVEKFVENINK